MTTASCLHVYCARMHVRALVRSKCRIGKMATRYCACIIFGVNSSVYLVPHLNSKTAFPPIFNLFSPLGAKGIYTAYHSPMSMIAGHTCKWMYNNNSILFLKMHGCNELLIGGGIWYMHKLIIASSTTLQISAKLHKLLPLTSTSHTCADF